MALTDFNYSLFLQGPMMKHLAELGRRLRRIMFSILVFLAIFFIFGPRYIRIHAFVLKLPFMKPIVITSIPILVPSFLNSFSNVLVRFFIYSEVPHGLVIINVGVFDAIFASLEVSMLFSIIFSMPVILTELWRFASPALYETEKKEMRIFLLPAMLLFIAGVLFAYFVVIPVLLFVVRLYTASLGVAAYVSIRSFISLLIGFMISFGAAFELPVVMATLTRFGFVESETWIKNWRYGVLFSFIIALILSPGVTGGLIETVIGLTLSALYVVGALVCRRIQAKIKGSRETQIAG